MIQSRSSTSSQVGFADDEGRIAAAENIVPPQENHIVFQCCIIFMSKNN